MEPWFFFEKNQQFAETVALLFRKTGFVLLGLQSLNQDLYLIGPKSGKMKPVGHHINVLRLHDKVHLIFFDFFYISKIKSLTKFELKFFSVTPWGGGIKIEGITKLFVEPKLQNVLKHIQIRLNPKDELSISKIERDVNFCVKLRQYLNFSKF